MKEDSEREERITYEIVVDAYNEQERAMGWYCYLENNLAFPFRARCAKKLRRSPLAVNERIEVTGMAPSEDCDHDMLVTVEWDEDELDVPLSQIAPLDADEKTREAVEDWHYRVARGYEF